MLTIFHGNSEVSVREKARMVFVKSDTLPVVYDETSFDREYCQMSVFSSDLFDFKKEAIFCDHVFLNEEVESFFKEYAEALVGSQHVFVCAESFLTKDTREFFEKKGAKVIEVKTDEKKQKEWNAFSLADALGRKDKKGLWLLFSEARRGGVPAEEIIGIFLWQLKTILLSLDSKTAKEAGISEFPFKKAKTFAKIWKVSELEASIFSLASLYHEAHRGNIDLMNELEIIVLSLK